MSVDVLTFGCRLNSYESEIIRRNAAGFGDAVVVNTCAVTAEAVRQARQAIRKARRERPDARIVVTGCAAQTAPQDFAAMPEVDRVLGNEEKLDPAMWGTLDAAPRVMVGDIMAARTLAPHAVDSVGRSYPRFRAGADPAAITAARSASFRSGAAIRARCRSRTWWRRCAASPRTATARWC